MPLVLLLSLLCLMQNGYGIPILIQEERQVLFARIKPTSLRELLLFASLYPETPEGTLALRQAWSLLTSTTTAPVTTLPADFATHIPAFVALIEPHALGTPHPPSLSPELLKVVDDISTELPHKKLKGHGARTIDEIETLDPSEVDIARALLLLQKQPLDEIRTVEATLDLLALELRGQLGVESSNETKISLLNKLLFHELNLRFPPESESYQKTAQFSEISSVLFSRRGICLGASVLYLALSQRIGLPLSIYTPPGHIFVAYTQGGEKRVIETTARGISIPFDQYCGLTFTTLPERTIKEVVGMVSYNNAAIHLKNKEWQKALSLYQEASRFEKGEEVQQMIALCELLLGSPKRSRQLAQEQIKATPSYKLENDLLLIDLSTGALSPKAAEILLAYSNSEGEELLNAIAAFQEQMLSCPQSLCLPYHLAHHWLSYGKPKEALPILEAVAKRPNATPTVHYLLALLHHERMNIPAAWQETLLAIDGAKQRGYIPRPLRDLQICLQQESPFITEARSPSHRCVCVVFCPFQ